VSPPSSDGRAGFPRARPARKWASPWISRRRFSRRPIHRSQPTRGLEGVNLLPILGERSPLLERSLFWRINTEYRQQKAVRRGEWKLLLDGDDLLLFNLRTDVGERNDLARERTDLVAKLLPLITQWEKDVDAEAKKQGAAR